MSNRLHLTVGEFKTLDDKVTEFGYVASDDYARDYNFMWETKEDFLKDHPTAESLWASVLSLEAFEDIDVRYDEQGNILIENDVPIPSDVSTASGFCLEGISY